MVTLHSCLPENHESVCRPSGSTNHHRNHPHQRLRGTAHYMCGCLLKGSFYMCTSENLYIPQQIRQYSNTLPEPSLENDTMERQLSHTVTCKVTQCLRVFVCLYKYNAYICAPYRDAEVAFKFQPVCPNPPWLEKHG